MTLQYDSWYMQSHTQRSERTEGRLCINQKEPCTGDVAQSSDSSLRFGTHQHYREQGYRSLALHLIPYCINPNMHIYSTF